MHPHPIHSRPHLGRARDLTPTSQGWPLQLDAVSTRILHPLTYALSTAGPTSGNAAQSTATLVRLCHRLDGSPASEPTALQLRGPVAGWKAPCIGGGFPTQLHVDRRSASASSAADGRVRASSASTAAKRFAASAY